MAAFRFRMDSGVKPISVADWRAIARRRVPDMAWNYIEGGADDLITAEENKAAFAKYRLRVRSLTGAGKPDLSTTIAGTPVSLPVGLAPVGATGIAHWTGDIAAARAAEAMGTRAMLSTASSYRIEEVGEATAENHWFQLHPIGGRARLAELMGRAKAAGYTALFITVDLQTLGNREGERRWQFQLPWTVTPGRALHMARHARWVWEALRHRRMAAIHFLETPRHQQAEENTGATAAVTAAARSSARLANQLLPDLSWDDAQWVRDNWQGRFYIKGLLDPDDAAHAVDGLGADGVVVSNHGGRQLDRCLASIDALPAVAARVGGRGEVYLDGGVRRGTDVITALCAGAKGVFVGRPFVYGLAGAGERGVRSVLEIFREEIERGLMLMGCPSVQQLGPQWLAERPGDPPLPAPEPVSDIRQRAAS